MVGIGGLEPPTPSLSGTYSNQLSYIPTFYGRPIFLILPRGKTKKERKVVQTYYRPE